MKRIFLAFAFRPNDRELANQVQQLLGSHDVPAVTGENLGGEALTPAVKGRIDDSDALIALLTRRDKITDTKYTTHQWVQEELNYARDKEIRTIALIETDVDVGGMYASHEYIPFDRENPLPAFLRLSDTVGQWKREIGRTLKVMILPPDLARTVGQDEIKCRYRFFAEKWTKWNETGEAIRETGGTFVFLAGVRDDYIIQLEVKLQDAKWQSVATPQWVQIELSQI
ncbi:MAG: hypothetical protein QOJ02_1095 [Acidobacteriota bacterium]|jgi:hypothetical protein|nr:hypothetical protein [Acidobacteriota bacterium]